MPLPTTLFFDEGVAKSIAVASIFQYTLKIKVVIHRELSLQYKLRYASLNL